MENRVVKEKIKSLLSCSLGVLVTYVLIGLYAPHYNIEEYKMGHDSLGEYHAVKAPDIKGLQKFIGLTNIVVLDTVSFGMFFKALALSQTANEIINEESNDSIRGC